MAFKVLTSEKLQEVLNKHGRQYLVGNLKFDQELQFIRKENIEIGMTFYEEDTDTPPHWHSVQEEYQFVIEGETEYTETLTSEKLQFKKGDFYYIESNTCYSQNTRKGSLILFIKTPSINDKVTCEKCKNSHCSKFNKNENCEDKLW